MGCSDSEDLQAEIEKLSAKNRSLEAIAAEYEASAERFKTDVKALTAETGQLRARVSDLERELEVQTRRATRTREPNQGPSRRPSGTAAPRAQGQARNPVDQRTGIEVLSASARATDRRSSWWRFGWVVSLKNHSDSLQTFRLTIQFMDAGGYVIDNARANGLTVDAGQERTFRDSTLVNMPGASNVKSVNAVISQ